MIVVVVVVVVVSPFGFKASPWRPLHLLFHYLPFIFIVMVSLSKKTSKKRRGAPSSSARFQPPSLPALSASESTRNNVIVYIKGNIVKSGQIKFLAFDW